MKKLSLLVFSVTLVAAACVKIENTSELDGFTGIDVEVGDNGAESGLRLLILNEGAYPNTSTLDLLDLSGKKFYADIFGQANPDVAQGIGNTGNDIHYAGGLIWVPLNGSNQIVGFKGNSFKEAVRLDVESPRSMVSDNNYAYISSYGAAVYGGNAVNGKVYRLDLEDNSLKTMEVGYQPEGMAILNNKLYVANSGGYNYVHDNRVSVINLTNFKYEKAITLPVTNLNMMRVSDDKLWISTYGESSWSQDAAGNWIQSVSAPMALVALKADGTSKVIEGVHADKMTLSGNTIYAIGNDAEMTGGYDLCLYKVDTATENVETIHFAGTDLAKVGYPYCILVNPLTSDILIADASFTGDSTLYCFTKDYKEKWSVTTGVGTGHLMLYQY